MQLNSNYCTISSDRKIEEFFNKFILDYNKEKCNVYNLYLFLKKIDYTKSSCVIMTAIQLSRIPDIFKESNYTSQLLGLYRSFAKTIDLSIYELCNHISNPTRTTMLITIMSELFALEWIDNESTLLKLNAMYLLSDLNYNNRDIFEYKRLFKFKNTVIIFNNLVLSMYDTSRANEILYIVYKEFIQHEPDYVTVFMNNIPVKLKIKIISGIYPIYKKIVNIFKK